MYLGIVYILALNENQTHDFWRDCHTGQPGRNIKTTQNTRK